MIPHVNEDTANAISLQPNPSRQENTPLSPVLICLILDFLNLHLHTVFGENHVLLLHLLARVLADILNDGVHHVSDDSEDGDEEEEEDEGEDAVLGLGHGDRIGGGCGWKEVEGGESFLIGAPRAVVRVGLGVFWAPLLPGGCAEGPGIPGEGALEKKRE